MVMFFNYVFLHSRHLDELGFGMIIICTSFGLFNFCCHCLAWKQQYLKWKQIWPEKPPQDTALS
jgi:hypothetical protein